MHMHAQLLLALTAIVGASLSQATITDYSNTLSSYVASATGVISTYSFVPLSGIDKAFRTIRITNQGFSAASSPLAASCSNTVSNPTATMSTSAGASQSATFSFKTSSALTVAASGKITLTFPSNLINAASSTVSCDFVVPTPTTKSVTDSSGLAANNIVVLEVKQDVAAGQITVTCSGFNFKASAASQVTVDPNTAVLSGGVGITTSVDAQAARVGTPAVGAVVATSNALSLSAAVGPSGTASVSFVTSTAFKAHASDNKITLAFPSGLVTEQTINSCAITSPIATTTSSFSNDKIVLVVTSDLAAGQVTVTCSGLTLAAKDAVPASAGLRIETSKDTEQALVSTPAVGKISQATVTLSSAVGQGTATISFKTSTTLDASSANGITLTFPIGFITAQNDNQCGISSSATSVTSKFASDSGAITLKFVATATLAAGQVTVTCAGLTLAAKPAVTATSSTGLEIKTNKDTVAAFVSVPAVGAIVANAATALTMSSAVGTTGTATISFTTSTPLTAHATENKVILTFPAGFVTAGTANGCGISSPTTAASTSAYSSNVITITLTATATLAAGQVTVTCAGLTLAANAAFTATSSTGLEIKTNKDTVAAFVNVPAVGAIVANAATALTMSSAVGTTGTATISFTTSTPLTAHATENKVILTFPAGFVTGLSNSSGNGCGISSPTTAASTSAFSSNVITMNLTATATLAAGQVTVTCAGLTLAANAAVTATASAGLKIETNKDTVAAFVSVPAVGAIVANAATALTMSSAVGTTGTATISFTTSTPLTAQANTNKVILTFPAGFVTAGTANGCGISSPTATVSTSAVSSNVITITLNATATLAAGQVTVTCAGLNLTANAAVTATASAGLKIETNRDTVAAFVSVPAVGAIVANAATALTMSSAVGTTGTATISFTTSTSLTAQANTNKVILTFPAGFVTAGTANECGISSPTTAASTSAVSSNVITITLTATATLAAGQVTVTCAGLTLASNAAVAATASAGLKIETNRDTVAAFVSVPAIGIVTVVYVSSSTFTSTFVGTTLEIISAVDVWTVAKATVTCTVSSFTNAALTAAQNSRSLLQANQVQISALNSANAVVGTVSSTGQTFPASVPASPTRTVYLPKASSSAHGVAWLCVAASVILFWC
jgi:hypothetical protein